MSPRREATLVNLEPYGRLGNRLFLGAHLIAFSRRYELPLLNLGFAEYSSLFPWLEDNASFAFPWRSTGSVADARRRRLAYLVRESLPWTKRFRYWGSADLNFDEVEVPGLLEPLRQGRTVLLRSWLIRGYQSVEKYRREILEVFSPRRELIVEAERFIDLARSDADLLVAVHVRWEDYRGTPHFIDQKTFRAHLEAFRGSMGPRRIRFVLFSSESLSANDWGDLDVKFSPGTTPLFDLTAMARCDYILGPPSTFSGWASFYGQVPLAPLRRDSANLSLSDFAVVRG